MRFLKAKENSMKKTCRRREIKLEKLIYDKKLCFHLGQKDSRIKCLSISKKGF